MKLIKFFPLLLIFISFVLAFYFYPRLPDLLPTHWGINGQVDGYSSKTFALFFMPILSIFLYILFIFLPKTDPYRQNFKKFESYFNIFIALVQTFFLYIYLGFRFNMIQILSPAFAALFYYAGVLTSKAKRNWFVGIRTPWTLSSNQIWSQTHQLGGKLFKLVSLTALLGLFFPQFAFSLLFIPLVSVSTFIFAYSYWLYRKTL